MRNIVVVQADDRQFGLVVDGIVDTEEIVVKPLGKELKAINVFAGATIMGDGRVALILDVPRIAQRANVLSASRGADRRDEATPPRPRASPRRASRCSSSASEASRGWRCRSPWSRVSRRSIRAASSAPAGAT